MTNLQKLHLAECKISFVADEAFAQLTNLVDLDLSNNNLLSVPVKSFEPIRHSLRKLYLANNPIQAIEANSFNSLKHLETLDLRNCQLSLLKPNAFYGLNSLSDLKLADNKLTQMPMNVIVDLHENTILDLYGNPWHCDCELRQSIDWMSRRHVQQAFAPTCATPLRHKDIRWQNVKPEEFICPPQVINKQNDLVVGAGSNVSLACSARGSPPLTFVWFQDEKNLTTGRANVTEPPASTKLLEEKRYEIAEELGLPGQPNVTTSILYLFNLKLTDTSLFLCWVENAAGYTLANFSLVVNDSPPAQLPGASASANGNSLLQSIGLSQAETQLGIISIGFVIVLATAIILLLLIRHNTNRSSKSSQSSGDLKSSKMANNINNTTGHKKLAAIGTISGSSKFSNGGHLHGPMLADSEDIDDVDGSEDDDDLDDRSSSGSGSSCSKNQAKTTTVASGDLDEFLGRMRSGIITMDHHSMSPVIQFNNTLKKQNNNNNNTLSKNNHNQQSLPYLDTNQPAQPMHHFPSASNASSVPYYGNGSSMATTTSDLSPSSGSVNANFASTTTTTNQHHIHPPQLHHLHQQQQLQQQHLHNNQLNNTTNCDLQHHLNEMAPATNTITTNQTTSYPNDYQSGYHHRHNEDPNNMMPPMYYETSVVDPSSFHYLQQQQHHLHPHMNQPNSHMYPGQVANMNNPSTATMVLGHPSQQQPGDLVLQSLMQGRLMQNQRLRPDEEDVDQQFHHIL